MPVLKSLQTTGRMNAPNSPGSGVRLRAPSTPLEPVAKGRAERPLLLDTIRKLLKSAVQPFRPERPATNPTSGNSMRAGLARAAARATEVATVIDVGASDGSWTRLALEAFPNAQYLLFEAQALHKPALERLCAEHTNCDIELSVAGPRDGTVHFDAGDPFGGAAGWESTGVRDVILPMRSIDSAVAARSLGGPFLIKLDTHGFETAILDGAAEVLKRTNLLIVEAYNFQLNSNDPACLRFHELCHWIEDRGLRCIDMCDVSRRPGDQVLWQMDLFFAPLTDPVFSRARYEL